MTGYLIPWAGEMFLLKRIVIYRGLNNEGEIGLIMLIEGMAEQLGISVVNGAASTLPVAGDLWIGMCPTDGWDECAAARSAELLTVLFALQKARLNLEYIKGFFPRTHGILGMHIVYAHLCGHRSGRGDFIKSLIAVARDTYPNLPDSAFRVTKIRSRRIHGTMAIEFYVEGVEDSIPEGYEPSSTIQIER